MKILSFLPDKIYLKLLYRHKFNKKLNLKEPKTFNEKLQYLKIYNRKEIMTTLADKYKVRNYVKEKIGEDYLIPLYWVGDDPKDIPWNKLPKSFVIKANHGSGTNLIIKDKNLMDTNTITKKISEWLNLNYYIKYREWPYKKKNNYRKIYYS